MVQITWKILLKTNDWSPLLRCLFGDTEEVINIDVVPDDDYHDIRSNYIFNYYLIEKFVKIPCFGEYKRVVHAFFYYLDQLAGVPIASIIWIIADDRKFHG